MRCAERRTAENRNQKSEIRKQKTSTSDCRPTRAPCPELGRNAGVCREEGEDAAAEFFGCKAVSCGVEGAGDDPELVGAAGGGVDHFRMAAGERFIFFVADEENGKRARGDGFYRRDFRDRETGQYFVAI